MSQSFPEPETNSDFPRPNQFRHSAAGDKTKNDLFNRQILIVRHEYKHEYSTWKISQFICWILTTTSLKNKEITCSFTLNLNRNEIETNILNTN